MFQPLSNGFNPTSTHTAPSTAHSKSALEAYSNSYDLSFTTSTGDKLTLSMDANVSTKFSQKQNGSSHLLYREFSYEMKFESNGLTAEDKAQIQQALEDAQPMMVKFFETVNKNEQSVVENFRSNLASSLKAPISQIKNEDNLEQIKDQTAKDISRSMNLFDINEKLFMQASKLFEEIFDESKLLNFKV